MSAHISKGESNDIVPRMVLGRMYYPYYNNNCVSAFIFPYLFRIYHIVYKIKAKTTPDRKNPILKHIIESSLLFKYVFWNMVCSYILALSLYIKPATRKQALSSINKNSTKPKNSINTSSPIHLLIALAHLFYIHIAPSY